MEENKTAEKDSGIKSIKITIEKLKKHLEKNKHDYKTKRALLIKQARLRKLENYQKRSKKA